MSFFKLALSLSLSVVLSLLMVQQTEAMSFYALDMRVPEKCVNTYYPENTKLEIVYEMLDPRKDKLSLGMKVDDGPLTQTRVTFTIKPTDNSAMAKDIHNTHRHELKETSGKLSYKAVGEGKVMICVKIDEIPGRRYIKPALIGFRIKESGELDDSGDGVTSADKKDQDAAKSHMSEMERILNKMIRDVHLLLKNADLIKDDEAGFHRQSDEMNSAAKWWPMMHICVLLVTGFTQANHVVKFFKGKHII